MSHFSHAPGPAACHHRRPPSEPVVVVPGARVCPRVPRLPVTSVDGRPPDRTGDVALADVARLVPDAAAGNLASLTESGNPADSGISVDTVRQAVAEAGAAYKKPADGIPKTDLAVGVQASLDNADTAVQPDDILSGGKVKSDLLPSFVDDVVEFDYKSFPTSGLPAFSDAAAYQIGDKVTYGSPAKIYVFTEAHAAGAWTGEDVRLATEFPAGGERGKIYVALDTNKTYRWGGTAYVEISNPDLTNYVQKKSGATAGNFAKFTATGDIEDSGKKPADFANATHSHAQSDVTGLNAALAAKADKTYVDAKSSIKSPDGDTVVSANNDGTAKVTKTTHVLGNPTVTFPALYNIRYYDTSWTSEYGITMEFVGPVPSSVPYAPNDEFYYYSVLGTLDSYDPSEYDAWCIWVSGGRKHLMYKTGPFYDIDDFDSASPSLTLNQGESTSEPPVMTRTDSTSSTTKTVVTTDQIPAVPEPYTSNPNMDGSASAGSSDKFSRGDHVHPADTTRVPTTRTVNGKALSSDVALTAEDIKMQAVGNTTVKLAVDGRLMSSFVAPAFKTGQAYTAGTKVVYGSEAYEFTQDKAAGNWNPNIVKKLDIDDLLAGKASTADATLTERGGYSEWTIRRDGVDVTSQVSQKPSFDENVGAWFIGDSFVQGDEPSVPYVSGEADATSLMWYSSNNNQYVSIRTALSGYVLGSQTTEPLASEAEAEALRTGKQSKITASGILKGDGAGGVSAATAGTDYQAPLGFTPENASNRVTSLTAQSTDTQYPSAKCVYDAIQGVDVKPTRIYNAGGTDALDDKGQLYKSLEQGNYWMVGSYKYTYVGYSESAYKWRYGTLDEIGYNPSNGKIIERFGSGWWNVYERATVTSGLNPANGDTIPNLPDVQFRYGWGATFTPLTTTMETTPYAHFALESLPDRTWAAGVWAVGDLVKYNSKAYRCKSATTASDTTAPSSDTTHWQEIPILAQKQDALSQTQLDNIAAVPDKQDALSQTQLDNIAAIPNKAPLASPSFTGTPTAPTPTSGDNSTKIATTAFVQGENRYNMTGTWNGLTPPGGNTVSLYTLSSSTTLNVADSSTFTSGRVLDFVVDVKNSTSSQATIKFGGLNSDWYAVVNAGTNLTDMTTIAGNEIARFRFTQMAFTKNDKPVIRITKQVVTDVGSGSYQVENDGTVTTEGELDADGTVTTEGELNADGTFTVEAS